jgi:hypothetical protein
MKLITPLIKIIQGNILMVQLQYSSLIMSFFTRRFYQHLSLITNKCGVFTQIHLVFTIHVFDSGSRTAYKSQCKVGKK